MKLPSLFKNSEAATNYKLSSWQWPSCNQVPKTLSFRVADGDGKKTTTTVDHPATSLDTPESCFTNSSEYSGSFSTSSEDSGGGELVVETVIRGLRSERLFFEPGQTSSILEEAKAASSGLMSNCPLMKQNGVVYLSMDSQDPYLDFKKSMEEMVEAHGLKDWDCLEELLGWYLRVNGNDNHGYIFGAFVDLLVGLAFNAAAASSPDSPLSMASSSSSSSNTTPCCSSLQAEVDTEEEEDYGSSCNV